MDTKMLMYGTKTSTGPAVLDGLAIEDFEGAGIRVAERRYGPKETIFVPGYPDDHVYFLLEGTVRLYRVYGDYKEATTALLKNGGVFGKLSLAGGSGWQDAFADAVTESRVGVVRRTILTDAMKRHPHLSFKLFSSLSERLRQSDEVIESLLHREVSTRLATLLGNLAERFGRENGSGTLIDVRLTHQDLANMIASTREAVSKVMSEFQREGTIENRNRRIVIRPRLAEAF